MTHDVQTKQKPTIGVAACAVLLNPSHDPERSTSAVVLEALRIERSWGSISIANLLNIPSQDSRKLPPQADDARLWVESRTNLQAAIAGSTDLIFGWGVTPLTGPARQLQREQVEWVIDIARRSGHQSVWMLAGAPRHPSRWRQFVGPQRGLYSGGTTSERIHRALTQNPTESAASGLFRHTRV